MAVAPGPAFGDRLLEGAPDEHLGKGADPVVDRRGLVSPDCAATKDS